MPPVVQLYCKKLDLANVEAFLHARPDHIGWQINLLKVGEAGLAAAVDESARLVELLRTEDVVSVLLLHPCTDGDRLSRILERIGPDIFLSSAERTAEALDAVRASGAARSIMVPVGIPSGPGIAPGYDLMREVEAFAGQADWYTTDTITEADTPGRFGCSGQTSEWGSLAAVVERATRPVIAAGGMTAGNVRALWDICRPAGFDAHTSVCTGGIPDREKAVAFSRAVRKLE